MTTTDSNKPDYRYKIEARPATLGGGWRLRLFEDGEEAGGGVIPAADDEGSKIVAFADAQREGDTWLASRPRASFADAEDDGS